MTECGLKNYYYKKRCDKSHTFFLSLLLAFIVCRLLEKTISIPAGQAMAKQPLRVYWTQAKLTELYND